MKKEIKVYIIGILIPLAVGGLSAFLTRNSMDIYKTIEKPPLAPPGIVFPIVWTLLYTLMGISSAMIYNDKFASESQKKSALLVYVLQLAVNFIWSILFFNLNAYLLCFFVIIILWLLILSMILKFKEINKTAAYLQIPYLLWVTFAGYLNLMIYLIDNMKNTVA